jgi:tRNA modification GTPase
MEDTIVAISTAPGVAAISIVRLSGPEAIKIASKIYKGKNLNKVKTNTINYGHIYDKDTIIDEVLVAVFRGKKNFTGEDTIEINCHGGVYVTNRVLELLLVNGARMAEAGEFTKRAFMNGRIDLTQAESVMDLIEAKTNNSLKLANVALRGDVRILVEKFREVLVELITKIEVNIDYPEYEDEEQITNQFLVPKTKELINEIEKIIDKSETSRIIKEGLSTAIIGKPNVGKSSLLNSLLRDDRAIVTNIPGTTRDTIEGMVNIGGVILNLIDTAGIRETEDIVEKIGVKRSEVVIEKASLIILVFDYNSSLTKDDLELLKRTENKDRIIVVNKHDLDKKIDLDLIDDYLLMSTFNIEDISKLETKIKAKYNLLDLSKIDASYIGNTRQIAKLKEAYNYLKDSLNSASFNQPIDIINIDLRLAWKALGDIIGSSHNDLIIEELFARFCLGK